MNIASRMALAAACAASTFACWPALATYVYHKVDNPAPYSGIWGVSATTQQFMLTAQETTDGEAAVSSYIYGAATNSIQALPLPPDRPPPALPWFSLSALSINDEGTVVGVVGDTETGYGFIYKDGVYTIYSRPGYAYTEFRAINNPDPSIGRPAKITGNSIREADGTYVSFVFDGNNYEEFTVPGAPSYALLVAHGINDAGQVVGSAAPGEPGPQHAGYLRAVSYLREADGTMTLFTVPSGFVTSGGFPGFHTRARGINNKGVISGVVIDGSGRQQIFVGTSTGFQVLPDPSADISAAVNGAFTEAINDLGEVAGWYFDLNNGFHAMIASPANQPTGTTSDGAYTFTVAVVPDTPIFIDPKLAVGYDYAIGSGDPKVATVRFPVGIGDSRYRLIVGKKVYDLNGGELFDFRSNGYPNGIDKFRVTCIDTSAVLDPLNSSAFPTALTFMSAGTFTGTQKPLTFNVADHALPALISVNICPRQSRGN
jgi:hypothetical protein